MNKRKCSKCGAIYTSIFVACNSCHSCGGVLLNDTSGIGAVDKDLEKLVVNQALEILI